MSFFSSAFRAMSSIQQSESLFQFSIQSCRSLFGIQSPLFIIKHSQPPSLCNLVFRTSSFTITHSEPLVSLVFKATFLAFKVVILFQFGVQSHITSIQSYRFLLVQNSQSSSSLQMFRALSLRLRVFLLIYGLESFFPFRALSSQPRVVHFIYDLDSFFPFRALSSLPRVVHFIYDPESFFPFRALISQPRVIFLI